MNFEGIIDIPEVRKTIEIFKPKGELFEVRIPMKNSKNSNMTISGYFRDSETLLKAIKTIDLVGTNVYFTLNTVNEALYSRTQHNRFVCGTNTTKDKEIDKYEWLFVDFDPTRPTGISSSDEELRFAEISKDKVKDYLREHGFSEPIEALSGNGYHLLYRIDLENTEENVRIVSDCLKTLDALFSDDKVKIDTTNSNPSRVCKLHGTLAQKGANTKSRPHRMSRLLNVPDVIEVTSKGILESIIKDFPIEEKKTIRAKHRNKKSDFDIEEWMGKYGITYREQSGLDCRIFMLDECPFDSSHINGDSKIFLYSNGAVAFKCHHNSCHSYKWQDVREKFEPDAYKMKKYSFLNAEEVTESNYEEDVIPGMPQRPLTPSEIKLYGHFHLMKSEPKRNKKESTSESSELSFGESLSDYSGIFDDAIERYIVSKYGIFVMNGIPYIYKNGVYSEDRDCTILSSLVRGYIFPHFVKSNTISRVVNLFLKNTKLKKESEELNKFPPTWINFKNGMLDVMEMKLYPHDKKYLSVNQIPHDFDPGAESKGEFDSFVNYAMGDYETSEKKRLLMEYIGCSMTTDMRQQKFMIFRGEGGTGKGTILRLIDSIIGYKNISNIRVEDFQGRFSVIQLKNKLLNYTTEISPKALEDITNLKAITGDDKVNAEDKGIRGEQFKPFCKLLFTGNRIPKFPSTESSNALYRRMMVIRFDQIPKSVDLNLDEKLSKDIKYVIRLAVESLSDMLNHNDGKFHETDESIAEVEKSRFESDPVELWLKENDYIKSDREHRERFSLFREFNDWCSTSNKMQISKTEFYTRMESKGFRLSKIGNYVYYIGKNYRQESIHNEQMNMEDCPF